MRISYPYTRDDAVFLKNNELVKVQVTRHSVSVSFCSGDLWNAGYFNAQDEPIQKQWKAFCRTYLECTDSIPPLPPVDMSVAEYLRSFKTIEVLPYDEWPGVTNEISTR